MGKAPGCGINHSCIRLEILSHFVQFILAWQEPIVVGGTPPGGAAHRSNHKSAVFGAPVPIPIAVPVVWLVASSSLR